MNPYLSRGFAPVGSESDIDRLDLDGSWPAALDGTLYRIGPNPRFSPIEPYNPLMGDGMVHAFRIRAGGRVGYRNRWVRTRQWQLEDAAGRALFATSGDPRRHDPRVAGIRTDGVANTNLVWHAGRLLALEEGHGPIELDPATLETRGSWRFHGRLPRNMTAHPKIDPDSGELVFFANEPEGRFTGRVAWYVANARGEIVLERTLATPFPSVVHDFAVTRDYLVFVIGPVTISLRRARTGGPPLAWEPELRTRIGIVRRDGTADARWLETDPCHVWHIQNAWNAGGTITLDLCEQAAPAFPLPDGSLPESSGWRQHYARWRFAADAAGTVRRRRLSDVVCEYPRIDERFAMREAHQGFFACHGGPGTDDLFHRGIGHFDHHHGQMRTWRLSPVESISEPVFVPRSPDAGEGQGWLLCLVYDEATDRSHLAVFDAGDVERGPVARARVPARVPMGFHGIWVGPSWSIRTGAPPG